MTFKSLQIPLDRLLGMGTILSTAGILMVVTIQAYCRLYLPSAPPWTEESARFFFLFSVAFAAPIALREKAFVRVDTLARCLPNFSGCTTCCSRPKQPVWPRRVPEGSARTLTGRRVR